MSLTIALSHTNDLKVLMLSLVSEPINTLTECILYVNNESVGNSYAYVLPQESILTFKNKGSVSIPVESMSGLLNLGMIDDGYYTAYVDVKYTTSVVEPYTKSNMESFASISILREKFYKAINIFDFNSDIKKVNKAKELDILMNTLDILGENPGNSTDFWNKYNYINAQL